MFEAAVDCFGGAIGGVGAVEYAKMSPARRVSVLPSVMSTARPHDTRVEVTRISFGFHHGLTRARVGRAVGINDILVGAPSDLECDVLLTGKPVE